MLVGLGWSESGREGGGEGMGHWTPTTFTIAGGTRGGEGFREVGWGAAMGEGGVRGQQIGIAERREKELKGWDLGEVWEFSLFCYFVKWIDFVIFIHKQRE